MHRLLLIPLIVLLGVFSACGATPAVPLSSAQPDDAIVAAAQDAMQAMGETLPGTVVVQQIVGDYARAQFAPADPNATDPSYLFLKRTGDTWSVIAGPGTAFGPEDLPGVPESLWLDAPQPDALQNNAALPAAQSTLCGDAQALMEQTLGVATTLVITDVQDPQTSASMPGCQIVARGTGATFAGPSDTLRELTKALGARGWQEDSAFAAGGPTGAATGLRKDGMLGQLGVEWTPAPEANCPTDEPISACELAPEQQLYEVTLALAKT